MKNYFDVMSGEANHSRFVNYDRKMFIRLPTERDNNSNNN